MGNEFLPDGRHMANPVWSSIDISKNSGNLILTVLWRPLGEDGKPLMNSESAQSVHVLAYADETKIQDTVKSHDRIRKWCHGFNGDPTWFLDNSDEIKSITACITVEHEEFNGRQKCKARWVDPQNGGSATKTTISREDIAKRFGKIFKAAGVKVQSEKKQVDADANCNVSDKTVDRDACWAAYIAQNPTHTGGLEFWSLVSEVTHGEQPDLITPAQWRQVLDRITMPF